MYKKLIWMSVAILPFTASAQLGGLMNKAKNKINQRIDNRTDREMDKALDAIEGKETTQSSGGASSSTTDETTETKSQSVKGYSKFDFVPGERIIYAEDFAQDAIGELPLTWNSSGKGEVMTINSQSGKWLRIFENNTYLSGNNKKFVHVFVCFQDKPKHNCHNQNELQYCSLRPVVSKSYYLQPLVPRC